MAGASKWGGCAGVLPGEPMPLIHYRFALAGCLDALTPLEPDFRVVARER